MTEGEPKNEEGVNPEPERTSGIMKIANVSTEKGSDLLKNVKKELFDKQEADLAEREKTPEELEIINAILSNLPNFIRNYGGEPIELRPEHVHVIDRDKLERIKVKKMGKFAGEYYRDYQAIAVVPKPEESKLKFAQRATHESIHFNAFQSADFRQGDGATGSNRVEGFGVSTKSQEAKDWGFLFKNGLKKEFYFNDINEAITEELAIRFDREYFGSISVLADEISARNKYKAGSENKVVEDKEVLSYTTKEADVNGRRVEKWRLETFSYSEERKSLWDLIRFIHEKDADKFKSEEDIFRFFVKAYFDGKRLGVVRLIENTYGKGSYRALGRKTRAKNVSEI